MTDTADRRPHGSLLFGLAGFMRDLALQPGGRRRFRIADAASALGEKPGSVRRVLERRFLNQAMVRAVRIGNSKRVNYEVAENFIQKLEQMIPGFFPLLQRSEREEARSVALHLQALEEDLSNRHLDLGQRAVMLATVRDALSRDVVSNEAAAEIGPERSVRRPHLVIWFFLQEAIHHLLLGEEPAFETAWRAAEEGLDDLRAPGAPSTTADEMRFVEERFALAKIRADSLRARHPASPPVVNAHVRSADAAASAAAPARPIQPRTVSQNHGERRLKQKAAEIKKGIEVW